MSLQPGQKIKPPFEEADAANYVQTRYHLNVKSVKEMNSYDDRNFLVITDNDARFTLKVSNCLDSSVPNLMDTMNELLLHTSNQGVPVPVPIPLKNGDDRDVTVTYERLDQSSTNVYAVRLLTFIDGELLLQVPYTQKVLENIGLALSKLSKALCTFDNTVLKQRSLTWSLLSVPLLKDFVFAIDDRDNRNIVEDVLRDFESTVLSKLDKSKFVLIHGDFNEQNILVRDDSDGEFDVCGVLDFGDTHYAPQVFDLAILCTYAMLECKTMDVLKAPYYVIRGYQKEIELTQEEWAMLPTCVIARLAQSLTLGAYSHKSDPTNNYVLATARTGWTVLERLFKERKENLIQLWQA